MRLGFDEEKFRDFFILIDEFFSKRTFNIISLIQFVNFLVGSGNLRVLGKRKSTKTKILFYFGGGGAID